MKQTKVNKNKINLKVNDGAMAFTLLIILYVLLSFIVSALLQVITIREPLKSILFSLVSPFAITIVLLGYRNKNSASFYKSLNLSKTKPTFFINAVILAISVLLAFGTLNELVAKLILKLGGRVLTSGVPTGKIWYYIVFLFVICILPAVLEELFFRGLMLSSLNGCSKVASVLTVSLAFALYHANATQLVYQFIYGVILCLLTLGARSVIPAIITHFLNNFIVLSVNHFEIKLNLNSWWLILIGAFLTALSIFYLINKIKPSSEKKESVKAFYFPYALLGIVVCLTLIVTGVVSW